ncbi:MAG TPA: prepilin-type N-terminal cleavage/methylation domain-containing protein [Thermodesulfovibrionales bacterium]|nr:prepilin-type N-terminal cleavage/methylation domain-containing protein [Thermodesulfovibrionales bacterium]
MKNTRLRSLRFCALHVAPCNSKDGFTLLEVLVSVALLAMAVTIVLQLFSADLRAISASEDYVKASARANAAMRDVLDDDTLDVKSWGENTEDGYALNVGIEEVLKERTENLQVKVLEITLTVNWTQGSKTRSITLRTLKTVPKQA